MGYRLYELGAKKMSKSYINMNGMLGNLGVSLERGLCFIALQSYSLHSARQASQTEKSSPGRTR